MNLKREKYANGKLNGTHYLHVYVYICFFSGLWMKWQCMILGSCYFKCGATELIQQHYQLY